MKSRRSVKTLTDSLAGFSEDFMSERNQPPLQERSEVGAIHELPLHKPQDKRDLPEGWVWKTLGEVLLDIVGGGTPLKANSTYWKGSIPWLTVKDMRTRRPADSIDHISENAIKESATNLIPKDTVIIATRVGLGKVIRVPYAATINQDLKALIPAADVDKGYLEYWIMSIAQYLESIGSGTTVKGIRLETLRKIPFPLAPLDQQKLIVSEIEKQFSRLDDAVAGLKRIKASLKRYKASVLKAAVEGKLTEEWRKAHPNVETGADLLKRILAERKKKWEEKNPGKEYKEPVAPDTTNLPELPKGWVWASADQCTSLITDGEHITPQRSAEGVFLLSARNVLDGSLALSNVDYISEQVYEKLSQRFVAEAGDVLLSCSGSVGRSCIVPQNIRFTMVRSVAILKPLFNMGSFLSYAIRSLFLQGQIEEKKTQTAQANIFQGKIRTLVFPIPPINEQKLILEEIESRLSIAKEIEATAEANLKRAERLRQSILRKAFSGQLLMRI